MNDILELKNKKYKRFLEMEITRKKNELSNVKNGYDQIILTGEIKSLRHCLFVFNGERYSMRQAFLRWKELHGETDHTNVKGWFYRYIKENCDYYKIEDEYRIKIFDKELLELERPEKEY